MSFRPYSHLLCLLLTVCALSREALGQEPRDFTRHSHGLINPAEEERLGARPTIAVFRGYNRFKGNFETLCAALSRDGRESAAHEMSDANVIKESNCIACAPMFKTFASACKPLRRPALKKTKALNEAHPKKGDEKPHKQREPNIEVLKAASALFYKIGLEKDIYEESQKAVWKVLRVLRASADKTKGEVDYFSDLADVIEAAFKSARNEEADPGKVEKGPSVPTPKPNLDDLF